MSNSPLFSSIRTLFYFVGFWSSKPTKTYKLYGFLVLLFTVFYTTVFFLLWKNATDLADVAYNLGVSLTMSVTVLKILISKTSKFQRIITEMMESDEYISCETEDCIRSNYLLNTNILYIVFTSYKKFMVVTFSTKFLLSSFLYMKYKDAEPVFEKPFTYHCWVPFDEQKYYLLGQLYLNLVAVLISAIVVTGDFLVLAPVLYLICRLQTLKFVLSNPKLCIRKSSTSASNYYELMRSCILEHQAINRELKEFNSIIMYLILCDFLFHSTQIAGFIVAFLRSESVTSISNIFTLVCGSYVLFELFVVYWHGQILIDESGTISSSIYQSEWYEGDNRTKKLMILMMMRSHKPLGLTVGPFFLVNMELFLKIVKTVYTITTIFFKI